MMYFVRSAAVRVAAVLALAGGLATVAHSQSAGTWTMKAPLLSTWTEMVAVAVDGKLYAFSGGFPQKADVQVYDPATDKWQMRKPMPLGMDHIGTAVLDGK